MLTKILVLQSSGAIEKDHLTILAFLLQLTFAHKLSGYQLQDMQTYVKRNTIWHKNFTWSLIFMLSGRTIKLKFINWMEIYYTIAMTSSTKLGFIK